MYIPGWASVIFLNLSFFLVAYLKSKGKGSSFDIAPINDMSIAITASVLSWIIYLV